LARSFALLGVLQNDMAPLIVDDSPFFDLLQGSKAAQAGEVIVQAAIAYAGGLNSAIGITHGSAQLQGVDLITVAKQYPGNTSQGQPRIPSISTKIALCRRIRLRSRASTRPLMW
jgi:hypothetical protein